MNAAEVEIYRQRRVRMAEQVRSAAAQLKVCLVCRSIAGKTVALCPICHAYQWSENQAEVITTAELAATSVFPFTLGYAPPQDRLSVCPPPPGFMKGKPRG